MAGEPVWRRLVLTGAGGNFMAGADVKAYAEQDAEAFRGFQDSAARIYGAIEALPNSSPPSSDAGPSRWLVNTS